MSTFSDYKLHPRTTECIDKLGYTEPSKIQEKAIPLIQSGQDVAGLAQTGTGKTAAFLLPVIQRLYKTRAVEGHEKQHEDVKSFENWGPRNTVLILVPTRELSEQVAANLRELTPEGDFTCAAIYGGVAYEEQKKALKEGVDFVIATPGRLIDLFKENFFDPKQVRCVIFDEADRMFDMGFKEDMKFLLDRIPRERQFLVFSATLNFDVLTVAYEYGSDPVEIEIDRELPRTEQVKDEILHVGHDEKPMFLLSLLKTQEYGQAIVFSNFVRNTPKIEKFLRDNGLKAAGISSALSQSQRMGVMKKFKEGEINILVATDVAARGLDIENVDLVINYELPDDSENYIHRIGRTGRAGREGVAISVVSERDVAALNRLELFLKTKLVIGWLEEDLLIKDFKRFPYTYDPSSSLKGVKSKGADKNGRRVKPAYDKNKDRPKKYEKKSDASKPSDRKKGPKKAHVKKEGEQVAPKHVKYKKAKPSKKSTSSSSRYSHLKSKPRGNAKKGLIQKIIGLFTD